MSVRASDDEDDIVPTSVRRVRTFGHESTHREVAAAWIKICTTVENRSPDRWNRFHLLVEDIR